MKSSVFPSDFQDVLKHRRFIYGFAALWILLYHLEAKIPSSGILRIPALIQSAGACGVEIFLIFAAIGSYRSLQNHPGVKDYYRKRLSRVWPISFLVTLVRMGVVGKCTPIEFLHGGILFIPFWAGWTASWFVAFILTAYLFYPLLFRLQKKRPGAIWLLFALSVIAAFVAEVKFSAPLGTERLRALVRIPVFLFGCGIAPFAERNASLPKRILPISAACAIPLLALWRIMYRFGFQHFFYAAAFLPTAVLMILLAAGAAEFMCARCRGLYRFFAFCGDISLEIYLLFTRIRYMIGEFGTPFAQDCIAALLTLALAPLLRAACTYLLSVFRSTPVPDADRNTKIR